MVDRYFRLASPLAAFVTPDVAFWSVHPASVVLVGIYIFGAYASVSIQQSPMWRAVDTHETREDQPEDEEDAQKSVVALLVPFLALMLLLGFAGYAIARSAGALTEQLGLSSALVGALMTAVVTSLPELVTTLAAVRRGALQLAVGGIIGGNTFDVLFLTLSDISYRDGSLYHAIGTGDLFWVVVGLAMTAVLLIGLILREKSGPANMGWESLTMLGIYGGAVGFQAWSG